MRLPTTLSKLISFFMQKLHQDWFSFRKLPLQKLKVLFLPYAKQIHAEFSRVAFQTNESNKPEALSEGCCWNMGNHVLPGPSLSKAGELFLRVELVRRMDWTSLVLTGSHLCVLQML